MDATALDLAVPLDQTAYRRAVKLLTERGLIEKGRQTNYGREVDALPVERPWGELLVHADDDLTPIVAVCASIESLHRMTREERELHGVLSSGSDHLTAYKCPRDVEFRGSLPKTNVGKILRRELRDEAKRSKPREAALQR